MACLNRYFNNQLGQCLILAVPAYFKARNFRINDTVKSIKKNPVYGHQFALLYVYDSGAPTLYNGSMSITWVLSIL